MRKIKIWKLPKNYALYLPVPTGTLIAKNSEVEEEKKINTGKRKKLYGYQFIGISLHFFRRWHFQASLIETKHVVQLCQSHSSNSGIGVLTKCRGIKDLKAKTARKSQHKRYVNIWGLHACSRIRLWIIRFFQFKLLFNSMDVDSESHMVIMINQWKSVRIN